jgi:glycosyltransferase involved in cell wall biosynthesis
VISEDDVAAFARAIIGVARDEALRSRLIAGCKQSAVEISIEEMIRRFGDGILSALRIDSAGTTQDETGQA